MRSWHFEAKLLFEAELLFYLLLIVNYFNSKKNQRP
jgi:hypothetical protein